MGLLNPVRDMLWFIRIEQFLPHAYRLHVNHIGWIHNVLLLLLAGVVGVKLNYRSTHAKGAPNCRTAGHIEEDRAAGFTKRFNFLLYLSLSEKGGIPVHLLLLFQFDLLRPFIELPLKDYQIRVLVKRSVIINLYLLC